MFCSFVRNTAAAHNMDDSCVTLIEFQNVIHKTFVVMLDGNFLLDNCIVKMLAVMCCNWGLEWLDCLVGLIFH